MDRDEANNKYLYFYLKSNEKRKKEKKENTVIHF